MDRITPPEGAIGRVPRERRPIDRKNPNGAVTPVGGEESAVGTERKRSRKPFDTGEGLHQSSIFVAPQLETVVDRAGREDRLRGVKA
jgi:hypothetical protein